MDLWIIVAVVITFLVATMIYGGVALAVFLIKTKRKSVNRIDIGIYELNDKGATYRLEKGRFIIDPNKGKVLVTVTQIYWNGIKEYLGYHITENDFTPRKFGNGRMYLELAIKDGLVAPLRKFAKQKVLSEEDKKAIKLLCEKHVLPISITENPETLSLTPIKSEQLRFSLDAYKDAASLYNDKDKNLAATLLKYAVIGIVVLGIMFIVAFILMIVMGPDAAAKVAGGGGAQTVVQYVNGTLPPF